MCVCVGICFVFIASKAKRGETFTAIVELLYRVGNLAPERMIDHLLLLVQCITSAPRAGKFDEA